MKTLSLLRLSALLCAAACAGIFNAPVFANDASKERYFHADISAEFQTSPTLSNAIGSGDFVLDIATARLSWKIKFDHLTSASTRIRLHGPAPIATNGPAMIDLSAQGGASPLEGSTILTDGQIEYLLAGWIYINISTKKYPEGELRGWLMRRRGPSPATTLNPPPADRPRPSTSSETSGSQQVDARRR